MNFITTLKKILKIDLYDDYIWMSPSYIDRLQTDTYIEGTKVLRGIHKNCNIILRENANLEIDGEFLGKIIGLGNNIVRIKGNFSGILSCYKLIMLKGSKIEGSFMIDRFVIPSNYGCIIEGNFKNRESLSNEIDFQYIKNLDLLILTQNKNKYNNM